jgi:hypothetical protein
MLKRFRAAELLGQADAMMGTGLNEPATAYLSGLHAAQALIFATTGRAPVRGLRHAFCAAGWLHTVRVRYPEALSNLPAYKSLEFCNQIRRVETETLLLCNSVA